MQLKIDIEDYLSREWVEALCVKINLPDEVTKRVLSHIVDGSCLNAAPYFPGLFSSKTTKASAKAIDNLWMDENGKRVDDGFGVMAVLLAAAGHTQKRCAEMGIPPVVFYDTMSCFKETLDNSYAYDGAWSFSEAAWCCNHIAGTIYRLGTLEFEMDFLDEWSAKICKRRENEPVLSVHIQTGANITRTALDDSYRQAQAFFPKFFPLFACDYFYCSTWMLAPVLKKLLPESSKILNFQSDYEVVFVHEESKHAFIRIYNERERPLDMKDLPENTTLRRTAKQLYIDGGNIGWAFGLKPF